MHTTQLDAHCSFNFFVLTDLAPGCLGVDWPSHRGKEHPCGTREGDCQTRDDSPAWGHGDLTWHRVLVSYVKLVRSSTWYKLSVEI